MSQKQPSQRAVVVSIGALPELLTLREEILRSAGYQVFTVTGREEAGAIIESGECGVLLLCYSVPDDWRRELIRKFRRRCPSGHIVGITNYPVVQPPKDIDELVYGVEGPEALIEAVRRESAG